MMRRNEEPATGRARGARDARSAYRRTPRLRRGLYHRSGVICVEVMLSVVMLGFLSALSIDAILAYRRTADDYLWRRAALYAVDGQLQRIRAGAALDSRPPAGLVPEEIVLTTQREPGRGAWEGLTRVTATARVTLPRGREIREEMSAYTASEGAR